MRAWLACLVELLLFGCFITNGQSLHRPLRILTTRDGLPQSFVSGLAQDRDGFVWIGTRNGLARYDGIRFRQFQHNYGDTATIGSNIIVDVKPDKGGRLWIHHAALNNFDCLDPATGAVTHFTNRAVFQHHLVDDCWLPSAAGNIWCYGRNEGLYFYEPEADRATHFSASSGGLASDSVLGLLEDRQARIWMVCRQGIGRYAPEVGRFNLIPFPFQLHVASPVALVERANGELMLGDREKLIFYNPSTRRFRTVPFPQQGKTGILFIQTGPDGTDYFTNAETVYRYSEAGGLMPVLHLNTVSRFPPKSFLIDRAGLIWIGLNAGGICQLDLKAPNFDVHSNSVAVQFDVLKKELGLRLDSFCHWPLKDSAFGWSGYFTRSAYDGRHRLWIGLWDRVGYYNGNGTWVSLPPIPDISTPLPMTGLRGIRFAPDGRLWAVSANNFIGYYDTAARQWIRFFDPVEKGFATKKNAVFTDIKAEADWIWVAGSSGLLRVSTITRRPELFDQKTAPGMLPTDLLLGLEPDPSRPDLLWIGSYEGLICLNKKTLSTQAFSVREGLPDNTVYSIVTDSNGFLWLSTNKGLCRFHPVTHEVRIFRTEDGLPGDEFNRFHHLKLPDGRLAFGGGNGWVLFDPTTIEADTYQPSAAFTGLQINNAAVIQSSSHPLPPPSLSLNGISGLILAYHQNSLTFEFAGLEYNQPKSLLYRYRLQGYDDDWIVTGAPVAAYTRLPPGHYTLQINCTNTTGQWSTAVRSLPVAILPPWWRTAWAYALYTVTAIGIAYALFRNRMQKIKTKEKLILQQKEAEQLKKMDEMKSRFFSNVTHEFRTPLSLILAPAEQVQQQPLLPEQKKQMSIIEQNAHRMLVLINQLLDMAKLEAASMNVFLAAGSIRQFMDDLLPPFRAAAARKDIRFQYTASLTGDQRLFDADKLYTILANILSNAVKFTPAGGCVEVRVEQEETKRNPVLLFRVQDSGVGIAPNQLPFVFNRFYQADSSSTRSYGGTGIGLALAKELAELMGGTLTVESEPNLGSVFTLTLPAAKGGEADHVSSVVPSAVLPSPEESDEAEKESGKNDQPLLLIVEDNQALNDFIAQTLRKHYRVLTAANGVEGLKMAAEALPDIVISDLMMPEMDGYALCQAIKTGTATSHIAFVLLTAKTSSSSRIEGLQGGADEYLTKPFSTEELLLRVKNILARQEQLRRYFQQQFTVAAKGKATPVPLFLEQLYAIIEENMDNVDFSVDKLAFNAAVSPSTLGRKLSTLTGLSATELIKQYRMKKALQFLEQGMGVSETAYKVGYRSPSYFSTVFKSLHGITPSEYASGIRTDFTR